MDVQHCCTAASSAVEMLQQEELTLISSMNRQLLIQVIRSQKMDVS
jgi:hypothetical protein